METVGSATGLTDEQRAIRDVVHEFAVEEIRPTAREADRAGGRTVPASAGDRPSGTDAFFVGFLDGSGRYIVITLPKTGRTATDPDDYRPFVSCTLMCHLSLYSSRRERYEHGERSSRTGRR